MHVIGGKSFRTDEGSMFLVSPIRSRSGPASFWFLGFSQNTRYLTRACDLPPITGPVLAACNSQPLATARFMVYETQSID
jgi:hypothetical protein